MNWYKRANKKPDNWDEMCKYYEKRTHKHIHLVTKYCKKIAKYDPDRFEELNKRIKVHDDSKFKSPEYEPYVWITWMYKCKDDGIEFEIPESNEEDMFQATLHHVQTNSHHPEYHTEQRDDVLNKENRDQPPKKIVDATKMPDIDLAEMVGDWCGVSEERGNSPKSWADKNVGVRWKFSEHQKDLIYELIDAVWK